MPAQTLNDLKAQEKDARRNLILEAAQELFATLDFKQVTVRAIAQKANLGVGTIYNYYSGLDELFLDIFLRHAEEMARVIETEIYEGDPSLDILCRKYVDYLYQNKAFFQIMGHLMLDGNLNPRATDRLNETMSLMMDRIETILRATTAWKQNSRMLSHALFSALNGIMISYARYPGRTPEEIQKHTSQLATIMAEVFSNRP